MRMQFGGRISVGLAVRSHLTSWLASQTEHEFWRVPVPISKVVDYAPQFYDIDNSIVFTDSQTMAKDFSPHQQKVIKRYYENRDAIDDQRLAELVTNLYLSTGKKQEKMWVTAEDIMTRMELPPNRITHVIESKDPAVLARVVEELQNGKLKRGSGKKKA